MRNTSPPSALAYMSCHAEYTIRCPMTMNSLLIRALCLVDTFTTGIYTLLHSSSISIVVCFCFLSIGKQMNYQSVLAPLIESTFNTDYEPDYVRWPVGMGYYTKQPFVTGGLLVRFGWRWQQTF